MSPHATPSNNLLVLTGSGKLSFPDGGWYEGAFDNNEINGKGRRRFANGNMYTGERRRGSPV